MSFSDKGQSAGCPFSKCFTFHFQCAFYCVSPTDPFPFRTDWTHRAAREGGAALRGIGLPEDGAPSAPRASSSCCPGRRERPPLGSWGRLPEGSFHEIQKLLESFNIFRSNYPLLTSHSLTPCLLRARHSHPSSPRKRRCVCPRTRPTVSADCLPSCWVTLYISH